MLDVNLSLTKHIEEEVVGVLVIVVGVFANTDDHVGDELKAETVQLRH